MESEQSIHDLPELPPGEAYALTAGCHAARAGKSHRSNPYPFEGNTWLLHLRWFDGWINTHFARDLYVLEEYERSLAPAANHDRTVSGETL